MNAVVSETLPVLLNVEDLSMRFGGLLAVDNVDFDVRSQEVFAIIGPNGAGKTTVFNCVSGFYAPAAGAIELAGMPIEGLPSHAISNQGLARTFQNIRLFKSLTVIENLMVAQHRYLKTNLLSGLLNTSAYRQAEQKALQRAQEWLERLGLLNLAQRPAGSLAYGQQRLLEIGRCMITQPRLLLLDEPAAGLNPQETQSLAELIIALRQSYQLAVLLIEHDMSLVMQISERILVMEQGKPLMTGTPDQVRQDERVIKAYLGEA